MHPQLPLNIDPGQTLTFSVFWPGDNALLLDVLKKFAVAEIQDSQIYINGAAGSGKTHLLSASCQLATEHGYRIAYLRAEMLAQQASTQGYDACDLICIDDLHTLPADAEAELTLFALINRMRSNGGRLLISADRSVAELDIELPDLRTRLGWGASYMVSGVAEEQLAEALAMHAAFLGMSIPDEVVAFMLSRYSRDLSSQLELLDALKLSSLRAKRKITIPFVREVLAS